MPTIQKINATIRKIVSNIGQENNIFVKSGVNNPWSEQVNTDIAYIADMADGNFKFDTIEEKTPGHGVVIDGALVKDSTFDTNVAAAGVTLSGTTLAADGTDAAIPITITPKGVAGILTAAGSAAKPAY